MGVTKEVVVGQAVRCGRYVGEVFLIVPPMKNPKRELRLVGVTQNVRVEQRHSDSVALRDDVSYVVKTTENGHEMYRWPRLGQMEAIDG